MTKSLTAASIHALKVVVAADITATDLEPIIDQAIGIVNVEIQGDIGYLAGSAGSKTVTVEDDEFSLVAIMAIILAINALLSTEDTAWTIERRNKAAELVGDNGLLTRRYEAMIARVIEAGLDDGSTESSIPFIRYTEPLE